MRTDARGLAARAGIGVVITGAFFLLLWRYIDWDQLASLMRTARVDLLALTLGVYVALYAMRALRLRLLVPATPYGTMFSIVCVHNLLLRLLPMRTGDLSYAFLIRRAGTASLGQGMITLILIRLLDAGTVVVMFGATLAFNQSVYRGDPRVGFVAAGLALVLGVLAVIHFRRLLRAGMWLVRGSARALGLGRRPSVKRLLDRLQGAIASFAATSATVLAWVTLATTVQWLLSFAAIFAIMRAFSVPVSIAQAVLGGTASVVSGFLPIGGIGNFGVLEAGWTLGFALVGLETSVAVATALGFSFITLVYGALLGLVGWIGLVLVGRRRAPVAVAATADDEDDGGDEAQAAGPRP